MTQSLPDLTEALLSAACKAGADAADAMAVSARSVSVDVLDGALETAERSESTEIGLRVLVGQRQATVAASDLSPATMAEMAERAVAMARLAPEDPHLGLAAVGDLSDRRDADGLDLIDDTELAPAELEAQALAAEGRGGGCSRCDAGAIRQRRADPARHPHGRDERVFRRLCPLDPWAVGHRHQRRRPEHGARLLRRDAGASGRSSRRRRDRAPGRGSAPSAAPARKNRPPAPIR